MHDFKMLFLAIPAILALFSLPTPSASQGDKTTLPLTLPARVISNSQQAVALLMRCEKQQEITLPRTFETWYATPFYQPFFVMLVKPRPTLQWNPHKLLLRILLDKELQWNCCAGVLWHSEGVWLQQHHRMDTCSQSIFLWKWKESWHTIQSNTPWKWPTLGWSRVWIPSLLRFELTIWCDCPLVLQAAAPGWSWNSYL